ncbi:peptide chain release factor H [Comamonas composti]|uniref:peptide chain release factor H n=1 Tax=Comamonas composti TaxID=408558 RepID=UPI00047B0F01|nr:peptide chain release factor H [Comamonas composti]
MLLVQITAARGPAECERAVVQVLQAMQADARGQGVRLDVVQEQATHAGFKSLLLKLEPEGPGSSAWLTGWLGSVQCVFSSPFRPGHRRKNWFVGVQRCELPPSRLLAVEDGSIAYQACRASGKGGQHVNTTDSAVHAVHVASGISVKVMSERSQHANKRLARILIALKLAELAQESEGRARRALNLQHWSVDRGSPCRVLRN